MFDPLTKIPPTVSVTAMKSMRAETRRRNFRNQTDLSLNDIAKIYNPDLRGWINYYGRYMPSALNQVLRHFNKTLVKWAMRKFKQFRGNKSRTSTFLQKISNESLTYSFTGKKRWVEYLLNGSGVS